MNARCRPPKLCACVLALALASASFCPEAVFAVAIQIQAVSQEIVQSRLQRFAGNNSKRQETIKTIFVEAGCPAGQVTEFPVKGIKEADVICTLPGKSDFVIIVGGHFDKVSDGDGVVDNWSGSSLLPSLFQALAAQPREHTFVFIAFAGEERGLLGSYAYAHSLSKEQRAKIHAMVNLDTLGLGPTEVWVTHSDPKLLHLLDRVAGSMQLPLSGMNGDRVGDSDESSFRTLKVPCLMIHSITQRTLGILHTPFDKYKEIRLEDYYNTYRLLCAFLAYSDQVLAPSPN
jgi:Zn-dependent M28 family amino/carboxypeptidase